MVFYALKDKMKTDEDERVRYEAAKSLILVGKFIMSMTRNILAAVY